ncbi:hypothetical protein M406DRAFT_328459 [Cryphonectria parasitica EP155]|uniref:Uncharacterized protein n=1 Tax=Cryphonectria parasitica (strain ATCC 38755 / EP155) TaxID=660469 RepID=A0A9P5CRK7_CRYP1|nr:uncharacterized protein M406DRAFT_328459 [Cryphonectria parasitica EP155]KAF3767376.1 hypothetical protein M406DRAFT_328459 [Cryphonectria parasitica EP155]
MTSPVTMSLGFLQSSVNTFNMPKLTYTIENAPGKIYGKNSNELIFKEPSSHAIIYSTATTTSGGLLTMGAKKNKKQLFRGPPSEKDGGACVATLDEPASDSAGRDETLEMHHVKLDGSSSHGTEPASTRLQIKKTSSWVPLAGGDRHAVTFREEGYTWSGKALLKRDRDGRVVARVAGPWFWQGKLGDMEVDVPEMGDEEERRSLLEMVLATFVARWWGERVVGEERAKEAKRMEEEAAQAKAVQKKKAAAAVETKKQEEAEERKKREAEGEGAKMSETGEQQGTGPCFGEYIAYEYVEEETGTAGGWWRE